MYLCTVKQLICIETVKSALWKILTRQATILSAAVSSEDMSIRFGRGVSIKYYPCHRELLHF